MLLFNGLSAQYPGAAPIGFADTAVAQGGVLLLQGPSGSGKSTLLALACGLLTASSGRIVVAGQDVAALHGAARDAWRGSNVGFLPQRLHLSAALSVWDNLALAYFALGQAADAQRIAACLQALGVADLAQRKPAQLSGGQAQRVALARALLMQPSVILADEPTASLDDESAAQAMQLLLDSAAGGGGIGGNASLGKASRYSNTGSAAARATLVIATHDARVAEQLAASGLACTTLVLNKILSKISSSPANPLNSLL